MKCQWNLYIRWNNFPDCWQSWTLFFFLLFALSSCAHSLTTDPSYSLEKTQKGYAEVLAQQIIFKTHYIQDGTDELVESSYCHLTPPAEETKQDIEKAVTQKISYWLLFHDEGNGFKMEGLCQNPLTQAFLSRGFDVLAINREGYGGSTGGKVFLDKGQGTAIKVAFDRFKSYKNGTDLTLAGIWGYGAGANEALWFSKTQDNADKILIVGGGMYDLPLLLKSTKNINLKKQLVRSKKYQANFLDDTSIAFDFDDLTMKAIYIYHGSADEVVPVNQAQTFVDALRTSEKPVKLRLIDKAKHEIPSASQRDVVLKMLDEPIGTR